MTLTVESATALCYRPLQLTSALPTRASWSSQGTVAPLGSRFPL